MEALNEQIATTTNQMEALNEQIATTTNEIEAVHTEINNVQERLIALENKPNYQAFVSRLDNGDETVLDNRLFQRLEKKEEQLRKEKEQLMKKEEQLMKKEEQLMKKEEQLRKEREQLRDLLLKQQPAVVGHSLSYPCGTPFYNNIHNANEIDGFISFEQPIPSSKLKRLYIRESYKEIASKIMPGINKVIITGTPGIGKSLFLLYLLWNLVREGKRVLFVYHPKIIYYDGQGNVLELPNIPSIVDNNIWNENLFCLVDAKNMKDLDKFPYENCTFILSTSPRRDLINDFKKPPPPQVFYMPLWTQTELHKIAPLFDNVREWSQRFQILGGIPRYVLENTTHEPEMILRMACKQCELDDCIKMVGLNSEITEKSRIIHSLIHITSTSPFTDSSVCYASQAALDIIVEIKGSQAKHKMRDLLASCEGNPLTAALCGYIFEPYALEMLEQGGSFKCHQLVSGKTRTKPAETTLYIPASTRTVTDKVLLNQTPNQLHVPKTKNYAAIDAWIPEIGGFQVTVGKNHDIKSGAKNDLALLGNGANKFYWLLPPLHYHSFTKKTPQDIDQYAMLIPYPDI